MKRILVYGMTANPGGIERYLINSMLKMQKEIKYDFVTDFPEISYGDIIKEQGSEIYFIPAKGKKLIKHWKSMYEILKKHPEYRSIYFNVLDAGSVITMVIPWIMGRKIITHSHNGSTEKKFLHFICRPMLRRITNHYVACSRVAAEFMFGKNSKVSKKTLIIPNAIDAKRFDYNIEIRLKKRKQLDLENKFVVCHIGRLTYQKNPLGLIDIFEKVVQADENAVLLSIGTGDMEKTVKEYAESKRLQDKIFFMGVRNDIEEILQAADVFVLPSFYEGLPIVGIEAQAAGLLCVMSDKISTEVDVTGNTVFLPLDSIEQWKDEILNAKEMKRESTRNKIQEMGYDVEKPKHSIEERFRLLFI